MEMVSVATLVGVRVFVGEGIAVGVRVAVGGGGRVAVAEGPTAVGVGSAAVRVGVGTLAPVDITARNACEFPFGSMASPTITLPFDETPSAN
jgi:hypothetical protein